MSKDKRLKDDEGLRSITTDNRHIYISLNLIIKVNQMHF